MLDLPSNLAVYVCIEVFNLEREVLLVLHDDDWMFLCGDGHPDSADFYRVVGFGHMIDRDPGLSEVMDLERGYGAERSDLGAEWGALTNLEAGMNSTVHWARTMTPSGNGGHGIPGRLGQITPVRAITSATKNRTERHRITYGIALRGKAAEL